MNPPPLLVCGTLLPPARNLTRSLFGPNCGAQSGDCRQEKAEEAGERMTQASRHEVWAGRESGGWIRTANTALTPCQTLFAYSQTQPSEKL